VAHQVALMTGRNKTIFGIGRTLYAGARFF
jgi:hypothetical protein